MAVSETSTARGPVDAQAVVAVLADELRLQTPANGRRRADQHKGCEVAVDVSIRRSPQEPTIGHVQANAKVIWPATSKPSDDGLGDCERLLRTVRRARGRDIDATIKTDATSRILGAT